MRDCEALRRMFAEHGQEHVFAGWDGLSAEERETLLDDCARVDFAWLEERLTEDGKAGIPPLSELEPPEVVTLPRTPEERERAANAFRLGEDALRDGRAAALAVAGGQGSRLGFGHPKGCFPIGPVSGKTLFQWHAERILARSRRYGRRIPWYVMTSRDTDRETRAYFAANGFLGLSPDDVFFFVQDMVPSAGFDGRLFLSAPGRLAMNPDGHGGALPGLVSSGALDDMRRRGIDAVSYFQIDNPLSEVCDPLFLGRHLAAGAEMSSKVLEKIHPGEKLGVACRAGGRPRIVEYSDLGPDGKEARDASGRLVFWAGSIGSHMFDVGFLARAGRRGALPWRRARKKTPHRGGGRVPMPENCLKFETFVFDALPLARTSLNLEVERSREFAPVKNAAGPDSPESARKLLSGHFAAWLEACGWRVPREPGGEPTAGMEISPLYALDADELRAKTRGGVAPEGLLLLA